jgi:glycosyltransferase involved in cell wall biosynthesis
MMETNNQRRLRIAQVAPLWARVPPVDYGGAELLVWWLTEELVKRGHQVTLFASGTSRTSAELRAVYPRPMLDAMESGSVLNYSHYANASLAEAIRAAADFDVIHSHGDFDQIPLGSLAGVPLIFSLHAALCGDDRWMLNTYPDVVAVALSRSQVRELPEERRRTIPVIPNACDFDDYSLSVEPGSYLAFLGRMNSNKNPLAAIEIARAVDMPLILAGQPQDRGERAYFEQRVRPLIDGSKVKYIGPVNQTQKRAFLRDAAALLFPIQWEEPFGIVMIEAMASGTPVIGCNRGSVAEVVDWGITGFYGDSPEELTTFVPLALELDRRWVREQAAARFSHLRMVDEFVRLYRSLAPHHDGQLSGTGRRPRA